MTAISNLWYPLQTWVFILKEKFTYFIQKLQCNRQKKTMNFLYSNNLWVCYSYNGYHSFMSRWTHNHTLAPSLLCPHHLWKAVPRVFDNAWKAQCSPPESESQDWLLNNCAFKFFQGLPSFRCEMTILLPHQKLSTYPQIFDTFHQHLNLHNSLSSTLIIWKHMCVLPHRKRCLLSSLASLNAWKNCSTHFCAPKLLVIYLFWK